MDILDFNSLLDTLYSGNYPNKEDIQTICKKAIELLSTYPNVIQIPFPATICGDTHGQFFDLLDLFSLGGKVPDTNYLFLGDYVDRGYYSLETFLLLLVLFLRYPLRINLLRGNHESRQTTQVYGFYEEVLRKYNDTAIWELIAQVFDVLPLAAVVGKTIFCVHGGLSPLISKIDDIEKLNRKQEVPERGAICDLLWSDPDTVTTFQPGPRGAGWIFGENNVNSFNRANGFNLICRAHQLAMDGYESWFKGKLFTVWSAPNYCYRGGNPGSILEVDGNGERKWKLFDAAPPEARGDFPSKISVDYFM